MLETLSSLFTISSLGPFKGNVNSKMSLKCKANWSPFKKGRLLKGQKTLYDTQESLGEKGFLAGELGNVRCFQTF